jgi:hypothetical protein
MEIDGRESFENPNPIPKFKFTPSIKSCIPTSKENTVLATYKYLVTSSANFRPIYFIGYEPDINFKYFLDNNKEPLRVDCNRVLYTSSPDGTSYGYGRSNNLIQMVKTTDSPTTFIDSFLRFIINNTTPFRIRNIYLDYDSIKKNADGYGSFTITIFNEYNNKAQKPFPIPPPQPPVKINPSNLPKMPTTLPGYDYSTGNLNRVFKNENDLREVFRRDPTKNKSIGCFIMRQYYGVVPYRTWGATPYSMKNNPWEAYDCNHNSSNPPQQNQIQNYNGKIYNTYYSIIQDSYNNYDKRYNEYMINLTNYNRMVKEYTEEQNTNKKTLQINLLNNKFDTFLINAINSGKIQIPYNSNDNKSPISGIKISHPDNIEGKMTIKIQTNDGNSKTLDIYMYQLLQPLFMSFFESLNIPFTQEGVTQNIPKMVSSLESSIKTIYNGDNLNYPLYQSNSNNNRFISGCMSYNGQNYPVIMEAVVN